MVISIRKEVDPRARKHGCATSIAFAEDHLIEKKDAGVSGGLHLTLVNELMEC